MNVKKLSTIAGYLCLFGIVAHVLFCLLLITFGSKNIFGKPFLVTRIYKRVALPGPFFDERRIRVVPQFYISYKEQGRDQWTPYRNVEREHFMQYHNSFFDYASLKHNAYERFIARKVSRKVKKKGVEEIQTDPAFLELHRYLRGTYYPENVDSARILYIVEEFQANDKATIDTTFVLTYKSF